MTHILNPLNRICLELFSCFTVFKHIRQRLDLNPITKIASVASLILLAACNGAPSRVSVTDFSVRNIVEPTRITLPVQFEDDGSLTDEEKIKIAQFIHYNDARYGDVISLDIGFNDETSVNKQAITELLIAFGLTLSDANPVAGAMPGKNEAIVVIDRFQVTPPNCHTAALNMALEGNTNHMQSTPGFGCANQNILGQMIANPRDLIRGAPFAGTNAQQSVRAATDYRLGRTSASPLPNSPVSGSAATATGDGN